MFYKKCEAHQALLRTGCCGPRVVIGGGIWVVPYFHRLDSIDLAVKNISVEMKAERAVQTCDGIRSCLKAVFYVRVNDTVQDIQAVAQCLGHKTVADADTLADLFSPKFSDILYRVAGQFSFDEIQRDRETFVTELLKTIGLDLQGFVLDDCAIEYFAKM